MSSSRPAQWGILIFAACGVSASLGMALGKTAKSCDCSITLLMLVVAVAAGVVVILFKWPSPNEQVVAAVAASLLGVALFLWSAHDPAWKAETAVADADRDILCVRITAMRLCHTRQIMGVFDFKDVPQPIVDEATLLVGGMPEEEKLALCDRTFGDRINACETEVHAGASSAATNVLRVVLALSASAAPILLRQRFRPTQF